MAKSSKADANYQTEPKGAQQCARCSHFRPPESCTEVAGAISSEGWCRWFTAMKARKRTIAES